MDKPRILAPVCARSVGTTILDPNETHRRAPGDFVQVYWITAGGGEFHLSEGPPVTVGPGEIFSYPPRVPHDFHAGGKGCEYRFWTLDGPLAVPTVAAFGLTPPWPRYAGPAPLELFDRLYELLIDMRLEAERQASAVAYQLLVAASGSPRGESEADAVSDPLVKWCVRQMLSDFSDPALGIAAIAQRRRVDRSVLSRRFHRAMGVSPKRYLARLRMQNALGLLKETNRPVGEIARLTGFSNPYYFSRAVRQATGLSPTDCRRS